MEEMNPINITVSFGDLIRNASDDWLWIAAAELMVRLDLGGLKQLDEMLTEHVEREGGKQKYNASRTD